MCSNYEPVTSQDRLLQFFGIQRPAQEVPPELYPTQMGPFIMRASDRAALEGRVDELKRQGALGTFGLLPHWADGLAYGRHTYNARSETADRKPSFKDAWRRARFCIVPAEAFYETNYESGEAVRWRIGLKNGHPMGIAGLWDWWPGPDGRGVLSYTMLTVNADDHALMKRFHRPGEEKRMVVILDPQDYDAWLNCTPKDAHAFMRQYPADLMEAEAAPRPGTARRTSGTAPRRKPAPKTPPPQPPEQPPEPDLFS